MLIVLCLEIAPSFGPSVCVCPSICSCPCCNFVLHEKDSLIIFHMLLEHQDDVCVQPQLPYLREDDLVCATPMSLPQGRLPWGMQPQLPYIKEDDLLCATPMYLSQGR